MRTGPASPGRGPPPSSPIRAPSQSGESLARLLVWRSGSARPETQFPVPIGTSVAWCDLGWADTSSSSTEDEVPAS